MLARGGSRAALFAETKGLLKVRFALGVTMGIP
jgi:hypothetical protein